jgi:hypothetical protein
MWAATVGNARQLIFRLSKCSLQSEVFALSGLQKMPRTARKIGERNNEQKRNRQTHHVDCDHGAERRKPFAKPRFRAAQLRTFGNAANAR